jgi:hypothetical protein
MENYSIFQCWATPATPPHTTVPWYKQALLDFQKSTWKCGIHCNMLHYSKVTTQMKNKPSQSVKSTFCVLSITRTDVLRTQVTAWGGSQGVQPLPVLNFVWVPCIPLQWAERALKSQSQHALIASRYPSKALWGVMTSYCQQTLEKPNL